MDCTSNNSATLKQNGNHNVAQQINNQGEDEQVKQQEMTTIMVVNKGKRTKRQRLLNSDSSPIRLQKDEEQLDLAKCLILLAQGQSRPSSSYSPPPVLVESDQLSGSKKRRRSYSSSSLNLGLAPGVYECQTCNRTFSSFQALGGHRASHKKLNITTSPTSYHDYLQLGNINYSRAEAPPNPISISTPTTSAVVNAQITNINNNNNNKKSTSKIHECTICGSEFSSGQALGGHMRRHRGPVVPLNSSTYTARNMNTIDSNTTLSLSTTSTAADKVVDRLSLDLNMPASPFADVDTKFSLHSKQQSAAMVLSTTPSLVDCFH